MGYCGASRGCHAELNSCMQVHAIGCSLLVLVHSFIYSSIHPSIHPSMLALIIRMFVLHFSFFMHRGNMDMFSCTYFCTCAFKIAEVAWSRWTFGGGRQYDGILAKLRAKVCGSCFPIAHTHTHSQAVSDLTGTTFALLGTLQPASPASILSSCNPQSSTLGVVAAAVIHSQVL